MPRYEAVVSGYTSMYLFVFFDLPVKKKIDRKAYAQFRKALLKDGFMMLQFSVYARYCVDNRVLEQHRKAVRESLPPKGGVRMIAITSKMFEKMEHYVGREAQNSEREPDVCTFY